MDYDVCVVFSFFVVGCYFEFGVEIFGSILVIVERDILGD